MFVLRRLLVAVCILAIAGGGVGGRPAVIAGPLSRVQNVALPTSVGRVDSRLAIDLDDLAHSGSAVFSDAMKQASPWSSERALALDDDGNVTALAARQTAQTIIYESAVYDSGDYTLLYDGRGNIEIDPRSGSLMPAGNGRAIVHVVAHPGYGIRLRLTATDPRNHLRNLRLIVPGFESSYPRAPFVPSFLARLSIYNVLRFAHWSHADTSAVSLTWPMHPTLTQFTQAGPAGVAWEYQIALSNATGADPWFVIPAGATNFYITQLASLVHARLDPRLHPHFEYAQGAWRPGSAVNAYATIAGRNFHLATDAQAAALAWYATRSAQMFALTAAAFGADAGRLVRVLGGSPALPGGAADPVDRQILASAGNRADLFAVDLSGANAASRSYTRTLLSRSGLALAAAGGALSLRSVQDAVASTQAELTTWHAAGGGLFAVSSLTDDLAARGLLASVSVNMRAAAEEQRWSALANFARRYPSAHVVPVPLDVQRVLAPLSYPNAYLPGLRAAAPAGSGQTSAVAPALAPRPIAALTPVPSPVNASSAAKRIVGRVPGIGTRALRTFAVPTNLDINAGGPAIAGTPWIADNNCSPSCYGSGGRISTGTTQTINTSKVTNPPPMAVFQTGYVGKVFTYTIPGLTPNGAYNIRLDFTEYSWNRAGKRLFNVSINGTQVLTNFDIYNSAGGEFIATAQSFAANADSSGRLAIVFTATSDNATVQGIEINATGMPTPTPAPGLDINSGGPAIGGSSWVADVDNAGGSISTGTGHSIDTSKVTNPAPTAVYQSGRFGNFTYTIPNLTPNGSYNVRMHFAEYVETQAGQRVFNASINGAQVLTNFDIFADAGGEFVADIKSFSATASAGGTIAITFTSVINNAIVQGLELQPQSGPTPTPIPTPTPTPKPTPTPTPIGGQPTDVTTYHNDNSRSGWNKSESILTTSNVGSGSFGLKQTWNVDGLVMAQPLYVANYAVNGGQHNVVIVATEHDSVYAFDADSGSQLWHVSLGASQSSNGICGDIVPEYGINSTPVIDRTGGTIYGVAATEPSSGTYVTTLFALNLANGSTKMSTRIAASAVMSNGLTVAFDDHKNMQRASLLLANGSVYLGVGSHCDGSLGTISGWLLSYSASNLTLQKAFNTIEDGAQTVGTKPEELGAIWGAGFGPAADAAGNIYAVTGNGAVDESSGGHNYGMSVLKFNASLTSVLDWFVYANFSADDVSDQDFGSGGAMLIPSTNLLVAKGKSSDIYMLNQNNLGHFSNNNSGAVQVLHSSGAGPTPEPDGKGERGGPAYYNGPNGPTVFYHDSDSVITAYKLGGSTLSLGSIGSVFSGYGGGIPVVTSNGTTSGTGIVWDLRHVNNGSANATLYLDAYDATNVSKHLFGGLSGTWSKAQENCFIAPLVAHGKVYAGAYKTVTVFGL